MLKNTIIKPEEFKQHLKSLSLFPKDTKIAVAVSGGADSLCLAFLLQHIAKSLPFSLTALIVDHKLRKESTTEAKWVSSLLTKHKINNIILTRHESVLTTKIQEVARWDRYQLLYNYCKENAYSHLLLAHHLDDSLETMVMRKEKGNNLVGLAGISAKHVCEEVILLRPLLPYTKEQILQTIKLYTNTWVEDPSNLNEKFTRVKIRKELQQLTALQKQQYINELQQNIHIRKVLETNLLKLLANSLIISNLGAVQIKLAVLLTADTNLQLMYVRKIMQLLAGANYLVKLQKSKRLLNFFHNKKLKTYTVGGCIFKKKEDYIYIYKEVKDRTKLEIVKNLAHNRWDNRFLIDNTVNKDYIVQYISLQLYRQLITDIGFKLFMKNNFVTFKELQDIPCIFSKNIQQSWHNQQYKGVLLKFSTSLFMNKFV